MEYSLAFRKRREKLGFISNPKIETFSASRSLPDEECEGSESGRGGTGFACFQPYFECEVRLSQHGDVKRGGVFPFFFFWQSGFHYF